MKALSHHRVINKKNEIAFAHEKLKLMNNAINNKLYGECYI